jgi:hypothetical protein
LLSATERDEWPGRPSTSADVQDDSRIEVEFFEDEIVHEGLGHGQADVAAIQDSDVGAGRGVYREVALTIAG